MSNPPKTTLFAGIGSPHGDDQVGWRVADALRETVPDGVEIRQAAVPLDVLHWMEDIEALYLCDACRGGGAPGNLVRWEMHEEMTNAGEFLGVPARLRSTGSHAFGLTAVLELAAHLGTLPRHVVVWGVEGGCFAPGDVLSPEIERRLTEIATTIGSELSDA
jgi:hydrogenase maturation protease